MNNTETPEDGTLDNGTTANNGGDKSSIIVAGCLGVIGLFLLGCGFFLWKMMNKIHTEDEAIPRRERILLDVNADTYSEMSADVTATICDMFRTPITTPRSQPLPTPKYQPIVPPTTEGTSDIRERLTRASLMMKNEEFPDSLIVVSHNPIYSQLAGDYNLVAESKRYGMPVWKKDKLDNYISSSRDGKWQVVKLDVVSSDSSDDENNDFDTRVMLSSFEPHGGKMPHEIIEWRAVSESIYVRLPARTNMRRPNRRKRGTLLSAVAEDALSVVSRDSDTRSRDSKDERKRPELSLAASLASVVSRESSSTDQMFSPRSRDERRNGLASVMGRESVETFTNRGKKNDVTLSSIDALRSPPSDYMTASNASLSSLPGRRSVTPQFTPRDRSGGIRSMTTTPVSPALVTAGRGIAVTNFKL